VLPHHTFGTHTELWPAEITVTINRAASATTRKNLTESMHVMNLPLLPLTVKGDGLVAFRSSHQNHKCNRVI
jgi:hypothetical protein